jgi:adenylosuccinate synthase
MARCGIRLADLMDDDIFQEKLVDNIHEKNEVFQKVYGHPGFSYEEILKSYRGYREKIKSYICDAVQLLNDAVAKKKNLLFEGAQGTLLDVDHGTYPYVTSSSAIAGGACSGTGVGPSKIDRVIGVAKAYTTRVGEGPFPTEFDAAQIERIRQKGKEFGATTGRPRRCGWFDAVLVRHAVMVNGLDEIIITKLDVLDEDPTVKICVAYRHQGRRYERFPANGRIMEECEPIYEEHPGWKQETGGMSSFKELPGNAKKYIKRLSALAGVPIKMVSVGSKREQIVSV